MTSLRAGSRQSKRNNVRRADADPRFASGEIAERARNLLVGRTMLTVGMALRGNARRGESHTAAEWSPVLDDLDRSAREIFAGNAEMGAVVERVDEDQLGRLLTWASQAPATQPTAGR